MQPFDALTMRAILAEAKPVLLNRKVEKIQQISRDEVLLSLRSKAGTIHLLVSAQASFGRICLVLTPPTPRSNNPPPFCQVLRRHLASAILTGIEQLPGERIVDLSFSCQDELGNRSLKTLTAEIMGRHSNLILWENESQKILGASHNVTAEMSRQREVASGLKYVRPPRQEKAGIFSISQLEWQESFAKLRKAYAEKDKTDIALQADLPKTFEQWLIVTFAGLGRHLAEEIIEGSGVSAEISAESLTDENAELIWKRVDAIQKIKDYQASMRLDLTRFSVLSWWKENSEIDETLWKSFPTTNDLVDAYFRGVQLRTEVQQLKDRIRSELKAEQDKLQQRLDAAEKLLSASVEHEQHKKFGDMILAHSAEIKAGQAFLDCADLYSENGKTLKIELNPNLTASQNAQNYYRLFAKARSREKTAAASRQDAAQRLAEVQAFSQALEAADNMQDLQVLKEKVLDRGKKSEAPRPAASAHRETQKPVHQRLMSTRSSDGFTIIVGRNKQENDVLIAKLAHPHDIWLHAQGLEGAHVLIKLPNKKDPPQSTLKEAAQIAARFARTGLGGKVRVVYTYGKYVRKVAKDKPGLVRYENEKTLEVDTSAPMPASVRRLFS
ncbi:MAG: NFACT family protein [Candidatus Obscuribacterales bacterium]|nr:NFACT family protein [Candidatus Obscuribacterales bacterium]